MKKKKEVVWIKGKRKKNKGSGVELYSVSWETEHEQMAIKIAEIYKYEKNKEFYDYKMDQVGSSYWEMLKQNDSRE